MTKSAPHTLHHQAHGKHQRHLQSISSSEERASAALDSIRVSISQECSFPVFYTGCSAAQCVCLSAANMSVVSLLPTIPLSTSKTSINISAIVSIRLEEGGVSLRFVDAADTIVSVPSASSIFLFTALQDITGISKQHFSQSEFTDNADTHSVALEQIHNSSGQQQEQQQHNASFAVSGGWLQFFHGGTLQWREDICQVGHFVQLDRDLVGITSANSDLLAQLQAIAQWVLIQCGTVLPVSMEPLGSDRFLHVVNASQLTAVNFVVGAIHQAAVFGRKSLNCSDFNYGYDELKRCASSLPRKDLFNSSSLLELFQPFASSKEFAVHTTSCAQWDLLPPSGMRSNEDVHFEVEMWVACLKSRRVLALSKSAIMLLSAVTSSSCELKVLRTVHFHNLSPRSFHLQMSPFL